MSDTPSCGRPFKTVSDVSDKAHVDALLEAIDLLMRQALVEKGESQDAGHGVVLQSHFAESADKLVDQALMVHAVILALTGAKPQPSDGLPF